MNKVSKCEKNFTKLFEMEEQEYQDYINYLIDILSEDISLRSIKMKVKFNENTTKEITFGNYISYVIIFEVFNITKEELTDDFIINIKNISEIERYFDLVIEKFFFSEEYFDEEEIQNEEYNEVGEVIKNILNNLNKVSCIITKKYGPSISLYDFIQLAERNKKFNDYLYHPELDEDNEIFNAKEIVNHTNNVIDEIKDIICNDDENDFKYYIQSGSGVNLKQFGQIVGYIGLKPDLREKIIPKSINTNFSKGMRNVTDYYINAIGCLKALITSHIQVKNSGYFTRKLLVLLNDEFISDVEDCGTKHLIPCKITDVKQINHLNRRWYSLNPNGKNLKMIDIFKNDYKDLVNTTIYLRDPISCACKKGICKKCYGELWKANFKYNIGIIACLLLTNDFTQTMLGTKHLLQAKVTKKEFSPSLLKYFDIDLDKLIFKDEYSDAYIEIENIESNEEKENETFVYSFNIVDGKEIYSIEEETPFILNPEINIERYKNKETGNYILKYKHIIDLEYVFNHNIDNNGLSRVMLLVKDLIDKRAFIDNHDIFEVYKKFLELIQETNSSIDYIHIGIILRNMIKVTGGFTSFKEKELPEIKTYKVSEAIHYLSNSVSKPLLFEHIKKHFTTDIFDSLNKNGTSNYDDLLR